MNEKMAIYMAKIFVSHSSADKQFARRLVEDLEGLGHTVWLDEHALKVGDCIIGGIEEGLQSADHVIVVLSPNASRSRWVEQEWKATFWDEITSGNTVVLPVLMQDSDVSENQEICRFSAQLCRWPRAVSERPQSDDTNRGRRDLEP
jgi:hypothetical protein